MSAPSPKREGNILRPGDAWLEAYGECMSTVGDATVCTLYADGYVLAFSPYPPVRLVPRRDAILERGRLLALAVMRDPQYLLLSHLTQGSAPLSAVFATAYVLAVVFGDMATPAPTASPVPTLAQVLSRAVCAARRAATPAQGDPRRVQGVARLLVRAVVAWGSSGPPPSAGACLRRPYPVAGVARVLLAGRGGGGTRLARREPSARGDEVVGYGRTSSPERCVPRDLALPAPAFAAKLATSSFTMRERAATAKPCVAIALDASGSMRLPIAQGFSRIDWAVAAAYAMIAEVTASGGRSGIILFNHATAGPWFGREAADAALAATPRGGTDIAGALRALASLTRRLGGEGRRVTPVIVTDGDGDPGDAPALFARNRSQPLVAVIINPNPSSGPPSLLARAVRAAGGECLTVDPSSTSPARLIRLTRVA